MLSDEIQDKNYLLVSDSGFKALTHLKLLFGYHYTALQC